MLPLQADISHYGTRFRAVIYSWQMLHVYPQPLQKLQLQNGNCQHLKLQNVRPQHILNNY